MTCLLQAGIGSGEETVQDSTPDAPEGGMRFGVYEIDCREDGRLYELGRGAMGVTYRATDTSLQRKVALKIIKIDIAERSADARERFMREARAAASLRHENIATIHQFGMRLETGQYFYAMELIEGETLDDRVRRAGPLDARTTIGIAEQVTSALAAAEKHGLVHRDLKPANLMLVNADDPEVMGSDQARSKRPKIRALRKSGIPVVKIIDFGLAKAFHTATDLKSLTHDRFVGTPAFASPEQFEHSALDVRSDIYSLGETLWFALTGKPPFAGHTLSEIHRAQKSNALPTEQLKAAHVPFRLRSVLGSMLAFEPASRPGTGELAARLQRCSPEARKTRHTRFAFAAAAFVILGMSALFVFQPSRIRNAALNPASDKSIAVLPFENLSEEKANAFFAEGVQDEILTDLAKITDLKVISRTSVLQYKSGVARNLREIAQQLGVANVVEGSVQRSGNRVRVNAQLVDARNDTHLWAQTYDRDLADVFAIQSEIAQKIANQLQTKLSPAEKSQMARKPTENGEAYLAFVQAHNLFGALEDPEKLKQSEQLYERAIELDPKFALAFAGLSMVESWIYYHFESTPARREKARLNADESLRLQPNLPEGHLALGYSYCYGDRDYERALAEFEIAKRDLPNEAQVYLAIGAIQRRQGKWTESTANLERATALDPKNAGIFVNLTSSYMAVRNFEAADKNIDRAIAVAPQSVATLVQKVYLAVASKGDLTGAEKLISSLPAGVDPDGTVTWIRFWLFTLQRKFAEALAVVEKFPNETLATPGTTVVAPKAFFEGTIYLLQGDKEKAQPALEQARRFSEQLLRQAPEDPAIRAHHGLILAALGQKKEAIAEGKRAVELLPESQDAFDGPQSTISLAQIYAWTGESDEAFRLLDHLLTVPGGLTVPILKLDPVWDPLRSDPRFQKLCEEKQP